MFVREVERELIQKSKVWRKKSFSSSHQVLSSSYFFHELGMNPPQQEMNPRAINTDKPLWIDIIHCVYYNSQRTWFCIPLCCSPRLHTHLEASALRALFLQIYISPKGPCMTWYWCYIRSCWYGTPTLNLTWNASVHCLQCNLSEKTIKSKLAKHCGKIRRYLKNCIFNIKCTSWTFPARYCRYWNYQRMYSLSETPPLHTPKSR